MKTKRLSLFPTLERRLIAFGERLRLARRRRMFSVATVAERARVSRMTLFRIELGDPVVALGSYARVLAALQLDADIEKLALDDALGRRLQDLRIPERRRAPRKPSSKSSNAHSDVISQYEREES
jgi:transcriptional regulator with XRE-family HTH domain